jgi:hypothetical protein
VERIGEASGIAAAVIFLAGLYGRWMNGGILRAEGELPIRILAVWLRIGMGTYIVQACSILIHGLLFFHFLLGTNSSECVCGLLRLSAPDVLSCRKHWMRESRETRK